jgi:hypothetical protein
MANNEEKPPENVCADDAVPSSSTEDLVKNDSLLALRGSGRQLWCDEHADEYVRRLREGW